MSRQPFDQASKLNSKSVIRILALVMARFVREGDRPKNFISVLPNMVTIIGYALFHVTSSLYAWHLLS